MIGTLLLQVAVETPTEAPAVTVETPTEAPTEAIPAAPAAAPVEAPTEAPAEAPTATTEAAESLTPGMWTTLHPSDPKHRCAVVLCLLGCFAYVWSRCAPPHCYSEHLALLPCSCTQSPPWRLVAIYLRA